MVDSRGVSDVIGYVLVFSLVVVIIGILFISGFAGIEDSRQAEQLRNAERAFDVLADNINDIHQQDAPSRATEVKLSESQLSLRDSSRAVVSIEGAGTPQVSVPLTSIVYSPSVGASSVVYESGVVFRMDRGSGVMNDDAPYLFLDEGGVRTAILPVLQTRSAGSTSVGGETTVLVRTERTARSVVESRIDASSPTDDDGDGNGGSGFEFTFKVETTPDRASIWLDYLESNIPASFDDNDVDGDGSAAGDPACNLATVVNPDDTVVCELAVDRLFVSVTRIDVTFG